MVDMMSREAVVREVQRRLASAEFTRQLPVTADDGTKPITIAMREDAVSRLMDQVVKLGGAANVVVPSPGGMTVLTVQSIAASATKEQAPILTDDPTVGVVLAHVIEEGGGIQFCLEQASSTQGMASDPHVVSA